MHRKPFWGGLHPGPTPASGAYCILLDRISRIIRAWGERKKEGRKEKANEANMEREGSKVRMESDIVKN